MKNLTEEKLRKIIPNAKEIQYWCQLIQKHLPPAYINTDDRIAMFLAQTHHESAGFTILRENLNYSSTSLQKVFRKYFTPELAEKYNRKPEMIANRVYASRMGNGDEASGDGWKFRGRGLIQITGKNNYVALAEFLNIGVGECVSYLEDQEGALHSAVWYWNVNKLNSCADRKDIVRSTKIINGGENGLPDRDFQYGRILKILKE